MPTGGVVVDAFKNLIRHGKNHNQKPSQDLSALPRQRDQPTNRAQQQHRSPDDSAQHHGAATQSHRKADGENTKSQARRKDIEAMVEEERQAKAKLPNYAGLEKYKLIDKMGDGAFSNVYKAVEIGTGTKVAIKVVRKYELNSSQRANILKEVQIMRGTSHPSVVKLHSFSESDEHYYLVLELMEGGELFHQIVKLTYFSENLSRHVILQIANGIRYLHEERGVVHRDIKPENLLFERIPIIPSKNPIRRPYDEEKEDEGEFIPGVGGGGIGRVKIADFGLSKVVWNEQTMTPCGTVGYTAPEIVKDERYSKSVDMWALGCVLYTLLCGFPPFYDESINVLTEKVARGYYTFLSPWWDDISASAKDLITHLLCVDPSQRYTIDEFLQHPWCHAAPAPPPPPTPLAVNPSLQHLSGNYPLDSPLLQSVRGGGRSPGLATLKEAFDITYAVHRMEEEGARRRKYKGPGGAGVRGFLGGLNEDDEDMEDDDAEDDQVAPAPAPAPVAAAHHQFVQKNHHANDTSRLAEGRAGQRDRVGGSRAFELDMDGATLLGRRHKRGGAVPVGNSPLAKQAQTPRDLIDAPQSPMHY